MWDLLLDNRHGFYIFKRLELHQKFALICFNWFLPDDHLIFEQIIQCLFLVVLFDFAEHKLDVEKLGIYSVWRFVVLTHDEYLSRLVSRCLRFCWFDFFEELLKDPHDRVVIFRAKHFGYKKTPFAQKLCSQFERLQYKNVWILKWIFNLSFIIERIYIFLMLGLLCW